MTSRPILITLLLFGLVAGVLLPTPVISASSLAQIALTTHDLSAGFKLLKHTTAHSHDPGFRGGAQWTFSRRKRASRSGLYEVVNRVAQYDNAVHAAYGLSLASGRECGAKQTIFGFHLFNPAIGDFLSGCYYPLTVNGIPNVPVVAIVLRRGTFITTIRIYGTPVTNELAMEGKLAHYAAIVDRRIELVNQGHPSTGKHHGKPATGPALTILHCTSRNCLFRAQGRGSTLFASSWKATPKSWRFAPPPRFQVAFSFGCNRFIRDTIGFELTEIDGFGTNIILHETSDQRNHGTLIAGLPIGSRSVALLVHVQNSSCSWSLTVSRYQAPFPQP